VVQHCPLRGGLPGGFHRAVGGSCAGLHCAGVRRRDFRLYSRLVTVGLGVVALLFGSASIDYWTIMRFFGSRGGHAAPPTPERTRFFRAPFRFTCSTYFLFGSTRVCVCAGDYLRPSRAALVRT